MEAIQTSYGKAFEYSCLKELEAEISSYRPVTINTNSSFNVAEAAWNTAPINIKNTMKTAAKAGVKTLFQLEPKIFEDGNDLLELSLQPDNSGSVGDVRDILLIRRSINWEIGLSVKHNHMAAKHSRLSLTIDFGKEWFNIPCSKTYFDNIRPIFNSLQSAQRNRTRWRDISNKAETVYMPVLGAFKAELERLDNENPGIIPSRLLEYLLGRKDFYKLIANTSNRTTIMQCINFHGTLNKPSSTRAPELRAGTTNLPTRIYHFDYKDTDSGSSNTTLELVMNQNWVVSFRIHSASSLVESSLKFDIQIPGAPSTLFHHHQGWQTS
ncbi:MAG TPA: HaeIII family restriction endonuclease [Chitinophagaceae bacterium]|nr:HaeIII family restriction endonuclease [Chitinophagaceae bacterium]